MTKQKTANKPRGRFHRSDDLPAMQLTERDVQILHYAAMFRFIDTTHFQSLLGGSPTKIIHRLKVLFHNGYLDRPPAQIEYYKHGGGSRPLIYAIGEEGARILREINDTPKGKRVYWTGKNNNSKRLFIEHQLQTTDFAVKLVCASLKNGNISLNTHKGLIATLPKDTANKDKPFKITAPIIHSSGASEFGLEPDFAFVLRHQKQGKRGNFLVEIDTGSMPVERSTMHQTSILRKFLVYQAFWQAKHHKQQFKWPNFRVLFVTSSQERIATMQECLQRHTATKDSPLFYFAVKEDLTGDLLAHKFVDGHGKPYTLKL